MNQEKFDKGMAMRRQVLGDAYVDKTLQAASEFTAPLQTYITENCWGDTWVREGLSKQTRSLITVATLAALKASAELKTHVRGALRNGCSIAEIQEVLLHSTVYCGAPSGIEAFRAAKEVIDEWLLENPVA
ncbi:carboxymuconolactone decarboxylase family protein [Halioxenophilus sp. WMMB6]|uniref:carboxymuconolactone decarboxylase family protein n=1 Tax=Halioxenophilus sp. WMMB6 TaxID=3073815 RepID=UPI00295E79E1|nr:carboxymuconolactone decarboxylase family protein [Halioxenophilus sp. WMMB6]